ncbi:MAG: PAS domain S-box protein [Acidobacteriota bacterium]|nr:PAS domain S-box protein [Acidobacteriota bacterium]
MADPSDTTPADQPARVAEARWRAVIDAAVDGIIVIDALGQVEVFNSAAQLMFGYAETDVIGRNVSMLMPEPDHSRHDGYIKHHLDTGERRIIGIGRAVTGRRRDGTTFPLHLSVGEMTIDGERHFTGILHDLSRRHELEDRLREATAMARIGEMAAVIAHEVKNPLAAVRGAIQVIGGRMPAGSADAAIVKEVIARLDGLNDLVQDLLVFARPPAPKLARTDLRHVLAGVVGLLKRDPAFAALEVTVAGPQAIVSGDANLLTIVFQNLVINAAQAMQGRGVVDVTIAPIEGWQRVEVIDCGPGIPPEIKAALFRPFKTTKARGTGLGMATAKRLVELHGGRIAVSSPDGGGTTITVDLPAAPTN